MDGLNLFHSGFTSPHSFGSRAKSVPHLLSWNVIVAPSLPSPPFLPLLMSRDGPDYPSPFLGAHPSDTDLEETKFYADGPGIYPDEFGHGQIRPQRPRDASIPAALVKSQGGIALPPHLAASAKANPHIVGWISTQISTILAFLFHTSIFLGSPSIPDTSSAQERHATRDICLIPQNIVPVVHFRFQKTHVYIDGNRHNNSYRGANCWSSSSTNDEQQSHDRLHSSRPAFIVGQTESGHATAKGDPPLPATFNLVDQAFTRSTGGILPLTLLPLKSSTWFPGTTTLPAAIEPVLDLLHSLTSKYLLVQQGEFDGDTRWKKLTEGIGFTADLSCEVTASILVNVLIIVLRGV
ncbi:hypothetical protein DFH08DRAFT_938242 [Mycena albidolilacea]|uniref:Uncharacterized protein n=1 Tax=Mycena albidolilacea TaxID=1033008 RepID=A0AAD6ZWD1_9AGAR|nr:hypothetical protein DFH08DRAFT_938242 [Mycena albidolilacea]